MKIKTTIDNSIVILEVEGSLSSEGKIDFDMEISKHADKPLHLIIDLSKVTFIDSTTIGSIVKYFSIYRNNGKYLLLTSVNQRIYEVFRLTGITKQITIFDTLQKAVDFLREK